MATWDSEMRSEEVFRAILGDTLEGLRVPDRERREIVDIAENLRGDIVQG